jgi:hypothetical protein
VVGQQGRIFLLHGPTPVRVGEGGADGGGDRGGIRWCSGRVGGEDQAVDRPKDTGSTLSHQWVSVPGGAVNGDKVGHRWLRDHGCGWPTTMVDDGGVGKSGRVHRGARVHGRRGRSAPVAVVDDGGVGEAGPTHRWDRSHRGGTRRRRWQRGRAWRRRGRCGRAWRRRGPRGRARRRRVRRGRAWSRHGRRGHARGRGRGTRCG